MRSAKLNALYDEKDIARLCQNCERAQKLHLGAHEYLCTRNGVVDGAYSCRQFSYDLTKRCPRRKKSRQ